MALSVVAGVAALSLTLGEPIGLLLAGILALVLHLYIIHREEPELRRRFGALYTSYCERVPRWMPRLLPRAAGRLTGRS
jgi:protein-S-isoprenylcysteine O-methyltransferase Ste14